MSKEKKKASLQLILILLYIGSFLSSVLPLIICVGVNFDKYTNTPGDTVKLCIGGVIALIFLFLKVIGKLKMPRRIILFGLVFIMTYLLQAILNDLILLSGMALIGELLDFIFFQRAIKNAKERIVIGKTADATTHQVEQVLKKYVGRI